MTYMLERLQELPPKFWIGEITHELTLLELRHHDPSFYEMYIGFKNTVLDPVELMGNVMLLAEKVDLLRREGKISPIEELQKRATGMANMELDQMRKAFDNYSTEFSQRFPR